MVRLALHKQDAMTGGCFPITEVFETNNLIQVFISHFQHYSVSCEFALSFSKGRRLRISKAVTAQGTPYTVWCWGSIVEKIQLCAYFVSFIVCMSFGERFLYGDWKKKQRKKKNKLLIWQPLFFWIVAQVYILLYILWGENSLCTISDEASLR